MKTLQECKEEVAIKNEFIGWRRHVQLSASESVFETLSDEAAELYASQFKSSLQPTIEDRSETITLLEKYSLFLEKNGYLDTDWRTEAPFAIDEFLKS